MNRFHNILFVSSGIKNETEALQQAIRLAHTYQASLEVLIVCPQFSKSFEQYKTSYEAFLKENINKTIEMAKLVLPNKKSPLSINIDVEWDNTPNIRIIQRILRQSHDLLIKAAENNEGTPGFKALDMALLRKCPCTLFLYRPFKHTRTIRVAVAIDPENNTPAGQDLTLNLLKLAASLAIHYKGELSIISCWDFLLENFLRNSAWVEMPQHEIEELILHEGTSNYSSLNKLIEKSGIQEKPIIYHLKGNPTQMIPDFITERDIDVLVMGTVARTGISGFIIGNTAEDILQKLNCSLWAIKPQGYVSPVKAY